MKKLLLLSALFLAAAVIAPAQDWAKAKLDKSPRHPEWVKVKHGDREVNCFIVYPEVKDKAPAIVLIHEIFGLTDWARSMADELAAEGYIVIAPDLLWGSGDQWRHGGTHQERRNVGKASKACRRPDHGRPERRGGVRGEAGCVQRQGGGRGFCWGGGQSFRLATETNKDGQGGVCILWYRPHRRTAWPRSIVRCTAFMRRNDARVTATVPKATEGMKRRGRRMSRSSMMARVIGFMRAGKIRGTRMRRTRKARDEAFKRWLEVMQKI